ncbi:MAG: DUF1553 domain-containing protein [Verrucomicrobiales bacterium]
MTISLETPVLRIAFILPAIVGGGMAVSALAAEAPAESRIDFSRDVRPILSDHCFRCHGPDAENQKSDLRMDSEEALRADLGGYFAVVPGKPGDSEIHRRIRSEDPDDVMPPPRAKLALTEAQKDTLEQWIREGAPYERHWSLEPIGKPDLPALSPAGREWVRNGIDHFVAARLESEGLKPSPPASKEQWIRRVTLDLIGLPPTPEEVDAFLSDGDESAWETVVDRLMKSPHYGERMALPWLDAARYADTGGYQGDVRKTQWPWRDWVIEAFNRNLPFDRFTVEQLAGDLLPDATEDQRLATAFNRNHRINDEGGIIPEEFLVEYVADRVETTATVWMGLTVGCARCHDHKYDPVTQRDFYELYAFFHNIPEKGKDGDTAPEPSMPVYTGGTPEEHEGLEKKAAALKAEQDGYARKNREAIRDGMAKQGEKARRDPAFRDLPAPEVHLTLDESARDRFGNLGTGGKPAFIRGTSRRVQTNQEAKHQSGVKLLQGGYLDLGEAAGEVTPEQPMSWSAWVNPTREVGGAEGPVFSCVTPDAAAAGYQVSLVEAKDASFHVTFRLLGNRDAGEFVEVASRPTIPLNRFSQIAVTWDGSLTAAGATLYIDGEAVPVEVRRDRLVGTFRHDEDLLVGAETETSSEKSVRDELLGNTLLDDLRVYPAALDGEQVRAIYRLDPLTLLAGATERTAAEDDFLVQAYLEDHDPGYRKLAKRATAAANGVKAFEASKITRVSVMEEMPEPRETYLLERGAYDQPNKAEKLHPDVPSALPPLPDDLPRNRLGLARWLLLPEHPLTARVAVNRHWQMLFGAGLVRTSEDFGSQGMPPTHPKLLDWLATDFRENDWDVKALLKTIVLSATYRQQSATTPELQERDPENRLLARGPRFRLSGYALRDQALAVGGRMDRTLGGPPVMPYQPEGLWEENAAKGTKYVVGDGADLYRRSLYTFWRRTVPPPSMMNFDSSNREVCSVTLTRTNTPLQAMNLLNDPQYVEAARLVAERMMREGGDSPADRIPWGYRLVLAREPDSGVREILGRGYSHYLTVYQKDEAAAKALTGIGKSDPDPSLDPAELAALTAVASVILNLDETVTKE